MQRGITTPLVCGVAAALALGVAGCAPDTGDDAMLPTSVLLAKEKAKGQDKHFRLIELPPGFKIEKVADGLNLPTSLTWDDQGRMYVAEAGGGLAPEQLAPIRILRIGDDGVTPVAANLSSKGINSAMVAITWHQGAFLVTHRAADLTGAVSRVTLDGQVQLLFSGIVDNQSEHQINDIREGPDGMIYVSVGPAGNSGVMDLSVAPWIKLSPNVHTRPCRDIVLTGRNFKTPDFRTPDPADSVLTGAFVPFGTSTSVGQVIPGVTKCGGSILRFNPGNAEATLEMYAWGFRNLIGLGWDSRTGAMYAAENGYDLRGSRPVVDKFDASLRITQGKWYGIPDFSAGREPLTNAAFEPPDRFQAPVYIGGNLIGRDLGFVIDHAASGLTPPTPAVVLGRHELNSSPSLLDVAPASWGSLAGDVFIAEWGDLAPPTNPLRSAFAGFRVVRVDPETGMVSPFVQNCAAGPASALGDRSEGIERPFDVKFGPDGAMYIVDYGVVTIDFSQAPPYAYQPGTGVVWKVTRQGNFPGNGKVPPPPVQGPVGKGGCRPLK